MWFKRSWPQSLDPSAKELCTAPLIPVGLVDELVDDLHSRFIRMETVCIFVTALALAAVVQVQMAPAEVQTSLADISVFSSNFAFR